MYYIAEFLTTGYKEGTEDPRIERLRAKPQGPHLQRISGMQKHGNTMILRK